jgi:hypothetical protein
VDPDDVEKGKLLALAEEEGIGVGDLIEQGIKALGLDRMKRGNCPECERRKAFLNYLRINGWKITWKNNDGTS